MSQSPKAELFPVFPCRSSTLIGDGICGLAALSYALYDLALSGVGGSVRADQLNVVRALVRQLRREPQSGGVT